MMIASRSGPTALVTGASSGIGLEFAQILAHQGYNLVLVARNATQLEEIALLLRETSGRDVRVVALDLATPGAATELCRTLAAAEITIDVLINNAGYGIVGKYADVDWATELGMMQLNMVAVAELARGLLPGMLVRKHGQILNVASTAAFQPGPWMAIYFATKAFVLSFSEALAFELAGTGVTVTTLCPGATHTEFAQRAGATKIGLFRFGAMNAARVARIGYAGMKRGRVVVIAGKINWLLTFSVRFVPRYLATWIAAQLTRPR